MLSVLMIDEAGQLDRGNLGNDYGTMMDFFWNIVTGGGVSTDQDIWECMVDVVTVYNDCCILGLGEMQDEFLSDTVILRGLGIIIMMQPI